MGGEARLPTVATRDEIVSFCDQLLEIDRFEDYGPNGLQVPGRDAVSNLVTGVTANRELLARAVDGGADLVLVHHGLFFGERPRALSEGLAGRLRIVLVAETSVAAYHLPLDAHPEVGNNALLCRELGLEMDERRFGEARGQAIGVIGRIEEGIEASELIERVTKLLRREPLVFDAGPPRVQTLGIVTGAGSGAIEEAAALGLDALLTGEPAEHAMGDSREAGLHFIAAGHYATETLGVRRLGELIAERFGTSHQFIDVPNPV
jgi:dinuclear metal center YbgI/SA1388 family protein